MASTFRTPGIWSDFICPFTGTLFTKDYQSFYELESHIKQFRIDNQLASVISPYKNLSEELQDFFCKRMDFCKVCTISEKYLADKNITPAAIAKAMKAFVSDKFKTGFHPSEAVSVGQADKRLEQCIGCPLHNPNEKVTDNDIGMLSEMWAWMHKHKKSSYREKVGKCRGCGCFCEIKSFYTIEACYNSLSIEEKKLMSEIPSGCGANTACWQIKEYKEKYGE